MVHQGLAALLVHPDGRFERPRFATLYDLVVPEPPILADTNTPVVVAETLEVSRQHVFEDKFQTVRKEREHVADIRVDFLARSFNGLLAQADTAIIAAEEDVTAGAQGAEGRLRKAELAKATQVVTRDRRIALARRTRGPSRVCACSRAVPAGRCGSILRQRHNRTSPRSDEDIEVIAVQFAWAYEKTERSVDYIKRRGCQRGVRSPVVEGLGAPLH